jgi:glutaredoxin
MSSRPSARSLLVLVLLILVASGGSQWWHGRSQQRLGQSLAALAQRGDIRLLSSDTCAYCTLARSWLTEHRVAFDECFIEREAACRAQFDALQAAGTPMVLVGGQAQTGFDPERVLARLKTLRG